MTVAKQQFTYKVIIPYTESANLQKRFKIEYTIEAPDRETALKKAEREFFAYTQYNSASWVRLIEREGIRIWKVLPDLPQTPQTIDELAKRLQSDDEDVLYNTLQSLGALEDASASSLVIPLLNHPNPDISTLAAETLGKMGDPTNLHVLLKHYTSDAPPTLKATILTALARLAHPDDPITEILASALGDKDPRVRANAVEAVERLRLPSTARMLAPLLEDEDNRVRANVLKALWDIHDRSKLAVKLREMASHPSHWMRASAAFVLRHVRVEDHLKLLQTLLDDRIPEVHANAWKALMALDELECIPLWFEYLNPLHVADLPAIQAKIEKMGPAAFDKVLALKPRTPEEYRQVESTLDLLEWQVWQQQGWVGWLKAKHRRFFKSK